MLCQIPLDEAYLKHELLRRRNPCRELSLDIETRMLNGDPAFAVSSYADFLPENSCPACAGTGRKGQDECWHCGGEGTDPNPD